VKNATYCCGFVLSFIALGSPIPAFAAESLRVVNENINVNNGKTTTLLPNRAAKSLMSPTGWGASGGLLFIGGGVTTPQAYSKNSDAAISFGLGVGNPVRNLGVQLSTTMSDVSNQGVFSLGFKVHRYVGYGTSIAVGGENFFADVRSDANESYYIVASHAFQELASSLPSFARLHASIGVGEGRFSQKSPLDVATGKGKDGTYVFGALSYEVYEATNFIVDWNGVNLATGFSVTPFSAFPLGISVGVADLTDNSGDQPRFIASVGYSQRF
jgi:hypothetical protein